MRLIDADRARDTATIDLVVYHLDRQLTIDAVPVVRCKDCKYHQIMENKTSFLWWHNCKLWCADIDADGFCSYGERKDGD